MSRPFVFACNCGAQLLLNLDPADVDRMEIDGESPWQIWPNFSEPELHFIHSRMCGNCREKALQEDERLMA